MRRTLGKIDRKQVGCGMAKIYNGIPWFDQDGNTVNAHGACILKEKGRWYLFGEYKTDDENKYIGFSC